MKKLSVFLALISLTIIFIFSCKKEKDDVATVDFGSGSSNTLRTTVTGIVLDESNDPLSGVAVTAYGQTTSTNEYGTFVLKNINANKNRCVLQFTKAGFFKRAHGLIASANTVNYVRIVLLTNAATQNFPSSAGGTISLPDGSSAAFQPNSFVTTTGSAYTGTVNLLVKHLSPDDVNFGFTIPGGDLAGVNANNEDVQLYTYGMLGVELTGSSGEALQLAAGTSATLTMVIAASQLSSAPATIPLWYFDEATSLWKEEGSATKVGNNYVGTVSHFSWWNYDYQGPRSYIRGKVVDCNGVPLPNINVTVNGWYVMTTDQNGEFYEAVPCGMTFTIQVLASNNSNAIFDSQVENIPALTANQIFIVPDLVVPCPTRITGTLKSCSGERIDGFITLTDNAGFTRFQFTDNGNFNVVCIPNLQLDLKAYTASGSHSHFQTVTSLSAPAVLNVGNIMLCDSVPVSPNTLTLNGGPFSNQLLTIVPTVALASGVNSLFITMEGTMLPDYTITYFYCLSVVAPGVYTNPGCVDFSIVFKDAANNTYHLGPNITNPILFTLLQVDPTGGRVKGSIVSSTPMTINNGPVIPVSYIFNFDVLRN